jgi:hypothetical protein
LTVSGDGVNPPVVGNASGSAEGPPEALWIVRSSFFSPDGDVTSGQPGWGVTPPVGNEGLDPDKRLLTSIRGGLDPVLVWPTGCVAEDVVGAESDPALEGRTLVDAFRAACFCCATAMGERMSLICLSMKTGFFLESLSFWNRRRGFSS